MTRLEVDVVSWLSRYYKGCFIIRRRTGEQALYGIRIRRGR